MIKSLASYKTLIFDCDGVLLDSNRIKTEAFYKAALPYGKECANRLVAYHVANGGVSRFEKFELMLSTMLPPGAEGPDLDELLKVFAYEVTKGLRDCGVARDIEKVREQTRSARWLVVSGGAQAELREVFRDRGLSDYFDGGIFGSPDTKDEILRREIANGNIVGPALFVGDSKYDHVAAMRAGLDFVFVHQWTEFRDWEEYCQKNDVPVLAALEDLLIQ